MARNVANNIIGGGGTKNPITLELKGDVGFNTGASNGATIKTAVEANGFNPVEVPTYTEPLQDEVQRIEKNTSKYGLLLVILAGLGVYKLVKQ